VFWKKPACTIFKIFFIVLIVIWKVNKFINLTLRWVPIFNNILFNTNNITLKILEFNYNVWLSIIVLLTLKLWKLIICNWDIVHLFIKLLKQ